MAHLLGRGDAAGRDVEKALIALKKGAQLLKYGRKGKPKFCLFRLSNDETSLVWISRTGERTLKLTSVSRIVPGQRTSVFQRYRQPGKEYLSFSLIYSGGQRSLDLVCKDKLEAELWFGGLKALIASGHHGHSKVDAWSDQDIRDHASNCSSDSSFGASPDVGSPFYSLKSHNSQTNYHLENLEDLGKTHVLDMQVKGPAPDVFRISVSSAPSTSSRDSAQEDSDSLGDIYIWGEVICDNAVKNSADKSLDQSTSRTDVLLPKLLESNVVLDVQQVACGVRHAALVTKQGEVFTWGEESGGRLGHGIKADAIYPCLVDSLTVTYIDFVACGEFHTCAVTTAGEVYTWGDGTHNAGLLGHGSSVGHWIPRRVSGPLDGLQVGYVTCGTWHTALLTTSGQLYTFGDGTFGALGHGNRKSVPYPREVETLMGLKIIAVACGVWHTAAIVEVMLTQSNSSVPSGKLFTWGDGDKHRLGHGDKEPRLKPTCVSSLIDHNFHKLSCGHSLTVGLTTSGNVFTMGSTVYGQLGNPLSDGKLPCLVEDKLVVETVVEVACGSYHVAVMTNRNEVYTWGKGANGRLGHGDIEDRKSPTLVGSLKDRIVKQIACGSNFTAAICHHKWVSGTEQTHCSACRQAFGFTRKRHNCYNCGLVHCNSCSSKKAFGAALSPQPNKPYRVCDNCYANLNRMLESGGLNAKRTAMPQLSGESEDRLEVTEAKLSKSSLHGHLDLIKNLDNKAAKQGRKYDSLSLMRSSQVPTMLQLKDIAFPTAANLHRAFPNSDNTSVSHSVSNSRAVSPFSRKPSPMRSSTPVPTMSGLSFSKSVSDSLKKTNELLTQEVLELRAQVDSLRQRCESHELEMQKSAKKAQEAMALAAEESAKSRTAKEVIKSLTAQLKEMAEKLPLGAYDNDGTRPMLTPSSTEPHIQNVIDERQPKNDGNGSHLLTTVQNNVTNGVLNTIQTPREIRMLQSSGHFQDERTTNLNMDKQDLINRRSSGTMAGNRAVEIDNREQVDFRCTDGSQSISPSASACQVEAEWMEQYEQGVYLTLVSLPDGTRDLKRVRFSRRRFGEHHAEIWWSENRERVYEKYNIRDLEHRQH